MTMIDCRQVAGYWLAIALSIILFNVGIAIASFFTTYRQEEWRVVGVSVLGTGLLLLVAIPLLIRRNIRSRYREAFRSLPEAELRRKRCGGHCTAWMISAVHFTLGIAVTSYASEIRSKGWVVVGLVLLSMGMVAMAITGVHIYKSLRDKTSMNQSWHVNDRTDEVLLRDPTQKFPANSTITTTIGGKKDVCVQSDSSTGALEKERRWQSNPDIFGDLMIASAKIGDDKYNSGCVRTHRISSLDFSVYRVSNMTAEQIHHLSTLLDTTVPGWKVLAHKVAVKHRKYFPSDQYKQFLQQINQCSNSHTTTRTSITSNGTIDKSLGNTHTREPRSPGVVSIDNVISVESDGGIFLIDVGSSDRESLLVAEVRQPIERSATVTSRGSTTVTSRGSTTVTSRGSTTATTRDVNAIGVGGHSPTVALFELLKRRLPWLLVRDLCRILKGMGRHDIAAYIHKSHLAEVASNMHRLHLMYRQHNVQNRKSR